MWSARGEFWCPRRDSNPRPQDSYHFGLRRRALVGERSWSGLSLRHGPLPAFRRCPSSLYTFRPRPRGATWLGIGTGARRARAFPDFEQIHRPVSKGGAQFYQQGILCSILLSYADTTPAPYTPAARLRQPPRRGGSGRRALLQRA